MFGTIRRLWNRPVSARTQPVFYGQFQPPQDQLLYERYFPKLRRGVFIECGAFDGKLESSCRFFEESRGWKGYNIEACPVIYEQLVKNRPSSSNFCLALSNETGTGNFSLAVHPDLGRLFGNGSLKHTEAHKKEIDEKGCHYEQYSVQLTTYREFIKMANIKRLDLFVLDVEGHEESVLHGMRGADVLPKVMCVEYGWSDVAAFDRLLGQMGFRNDGYLHNNIMYLHESFRP